MGDRTGLFFEEIGTVDSPTGFMGTTSRPVGHPSLATEGMGWMGGPSTTHMKGDVVAGRELAKGRIVTQKKVHLKTSTKN